jgi:anaerobic selenocysteine-containing dehydrogenase
VICALAARLGANHAGFSMTELELIDGCLNDSGYGGIESAFGDANWFDCARDFDDMHFLNGFDHPDERFRFKPAWEDFEAYRPGMPAMPDHYDIIENSDAEHPFRMVTAPSRWFLNSTFTECENSRTREAAPTAKMHPEDCKELGVADGDLVRLGNRRGSVGVSCEVFDGVQPGVVIVESIWPNRDFAGGTGINTLVSAQAAPPDGGAVFHDTAVWILGPE